MFKPKLPQQNQGFTLVEVLVAIIITTLFIAVAMQGMVIAALLKARAQQYTAATNWIQQDLETVKNQAAQFSSLTQKANANDTSLNVSSVNGFADGDVLKVGTDTGSYTIVNNGIDKINLTLKLAGTALVSAQSKGNLVVDTKWCAASATSGGFANYFYQIMPTIVDTTQSIIIGGIAYNPLANTNTNPNPRIFGNNSNPNSPTSGGIKLWLLRNAADSANAPYNVLQLNYAVVPDVNGAPGTFPVATLYTEVIPNAALQCP